MTAEERERAIQAVLKAMDVDVTSVSTAWQHAWQLRALRREAACYVDAVAGALSAGEPAVCGRIMVGLGRDDTYDPVCELPAGHEGSCLSSTAVDLYRLWEG